MSSSGNFDAHALVNENRQYVFAAHGRRRWPQSDHTLNSRSNRSRRERPRAEVHHGQVQPIEPEQPCCAKIIDPETLLNVFRVRGQFAGAAPGLDELRWDDLSITEAGRSFRALSQMIRQRSYLPHPPRPVNIPKPDGDFRTLLLRSILDRTISAAILGAIQPLGEAIFLPGSMAYRPKRNVHRLIARLIDWIERGNRPVIAQADIRRAFDNVPSADAVADYDNLIADTDLRWLIEAILRGHEGPARTVGIDQGDPLSPFTLNMRLHAATDLPLERAAESGGPLWLRYADNYLLACQTVTEGSESIARLTDLLQPAGFTLKPGSIDITDLRRNGARTTVLGLELRLEEDGVIVGVGSGAIKSLRDALELAHLKPDPVAVANAAAWGWFESAGPALGDVERRDRLVLKQA